MKTNTFLSFFLIILISGSSLYSQESKTTIFGTVLDVEGTPIGNAMILIDNKETKVLTDEEGNFEIVVKPEAKKIAVIALGTGMIEDSIDSRKHIDFFFHTMSPDQQEFDEVYDYDQELVNTGYNKVRRKHVVTSISRLDVAKSKRKFGTLREMLMATPGLFYVNDQFLIGGATGGAALWVVDGVPVYFLPDISPSQVASIEVLKGTAAAIYGTRGFGGAVLITTKIP